MTDLQKLKNGDNKVGVFGIYQLLFLHLSDLKRRKVKWIIGLAIFSSLLDVVSISTLLPFLAILTSPEQAMDYAIVSNLMNYFSISEPSQILPKITLIFILTILLAMLSRILLLFFGTRFAFSIGSEISVNVYKKVLNQPYLIHVNRNSSEIISVINTKVEDAVSRTIQPLLQLFIAVQLIVSVSIFLIYLDPVIAIESFAFVSLFYLVISKMAYKKLFNYSESISTKKNALVKMVNEGLMGIRDIILGKNQESYERAFSKVDHDMRKAQGSVIILSTLPRYVIESVGMITIIVIAYVNMKSLGSNQLIPVLGVMALGAQKLLPAVQQFFGSWATITGNTAPFLDIVKILEYKESVSSVMTTNQKNPAKLNFSHSIELRSVTFGYKDKCNLKNISLTINKGSCIGIVGSTGSGKSSLLDVMTGLLPPDSGVIVVDGVSIDAGSRLSAWKDKISYVSQRIFLSDSTIRENIAFNCEGQSIDDEKVIQAAINAQIYNFIKELPEGFDTYIGENGVQLSGGQHQRIGIARALYKGANVLVLDEATSSLDNETERKIIDKIRSVDEITIIMVAHRFQTIKNCNTIFEMDRGMIINQGSYSDLINKSASFRKLSQDIKN
jgi:ATP-binding cassette, subfamily B, bacterial PglK